MALFITFEGGEGSGKTTQAKALYRRLIRSDIPSVLIHEPGGTSLGNKLRYLLKHTRDSDISPLSELLLFNASRAQLINDVIRPDLSEGKAVICDRYTDSTTVYQGYGRGLDMDVVRGINSTATRGLIPVLTFLMDIPVEQGLARKGRGDYDRFEQEDIAFHQRVRNGFLALAAEEPKRWLVVDARQPKECVSEIIWQRVHRLLSEQDKSRE